MKLISWNVNGLRACMGKGFLDFFNQIDADMFCIQETKMQPGQLELELDGYHQYWCSAQKKGYSGTALFCKEEPLSVAYELPQPIHASEGRVIAAEFERFYLVNVYTPNSQRGLTRLDYRMEWEDAFLAYIRQLEQKKMCIRDRHLVFGMRTPGLTALPESFTSWILKWLFPPRMRC